MVEVDYSLAYLKMILALGAIVAFLFWLKRYLMKKNYLSLQKSDDIKIITQKPLDSKNKITLISYKDKEYLLMVGESGFKIDEYKKEDFEDINNH